MSTFFPWITKPAGGGGGAGNPGGINTTVQYNNAGVFAGSTNFTFASNMLTLNGILKTLGLIVSYVVKNTLATTDAIIAANTNVILPASVAGKVYKIKNVSSTAITVGTFTVPVNSTLTLVGDGSGWVKLSDNNLVTEVNSPLATIGNQAATGITITDTPAGDVVIEVNGLKTEHAYFSGDGGITPKQPVAGDPMYWNGTDAGYNLSATDEVALIYGS